MLFKLKSCAIKMKVTQVLVIQASVIPILGPHIRLILLKLTKQPVPGNGKYVPTRPWVRIFQKQIDWSI